MKGFLSLEVIHNRILRNCVCHGADMDCSTGVTFRPYQWGKEEMGGLEKWNNLFSTYFIGDFWKSVSKCSRILDPKEGSKARGLSYHSYPAPGHLSHGKCVTARSHQSWNTIPGSIYSTDLLSTYLVPGTVVDTGDIGVNRVCSPTGLLSISRDIQ